MFFARIWFVKNSLRNVKYESRVVKLNLDYFEEHLGSQLIGFFKTVFFFAVSKLVSSKEA